MRKRAVKIASRTRLSVSQPNASAKAATDCGSLSAERAARQRASADGLRRSIAVGSAAVSLSGGFRTSGMTDDLLQFRCDLVNWQDPCRAADLDQFSWHPPNHSRFFRFRDRPPSQRAKARHRASPIVSHSRHQDADNLARHKASHRASHETVGARTPRVVPCGFGRHNSLLPRREMTISPSPRPIYA